MIVCDDLDRLLDPLSPAEWQAALTYWQAHGLTEEEARRAEAFARAIMTRHPVSLGSARAGVRRATCAERHALRRSGDAACHHTTSIAAREGHR
jgi:hypothetical protein